MPLSTVMVSLVGEYTLQQLAAAAGKKERTVRYYQQLGLLRQPGQIGPGAHYDEDDRLRLLLIGQYQSDGKSLNEILAILGTLDEGGVRDEALRHGSALDYVRSVLGGSTATFAESPAMYDASPATAAPPPAPPPRAEPTRWERIEVVPGIELHVRHPVSPERRRLINAYIARARNELEGNA